ncbi:MAG: redoxin domain-containing protein [Ktedonobacterales bacterium]
MNAPMHAAGARPRPGERLPSFALPSDAGGTVRLWDYKQRQPVLLALLHGAECATCGAWLAARAGARERLDEARVAVVVVAPEPVERLRALRSALELPFALLSDAPERATVASYLAPGEERAGVALYAADRYGVCLGVWRAADASGLPALDAPLADFALAKQSDCACALPAWDEE